MLLPFCLKWYSLKTGNINMVNAILSDVDQKIDQDSSIAN